MADIQPIKFEAGNVNVTIELPANLPEVADALINNRVFPETILSNDGAISLGAIKASASGSIKLDKINFTASGGAFAGFGVYRSTEKLFADLQTGDGKDNLIKTLEFSGLAQSNLLALRWGYNAEGSVSGTIPNIAFGAGLSFSAGGGIEGVYAVLRMLPRNKKSLDAIGETLNSWKMPRQVSTPDDLQPGTWLVAETDGQLKLSLGVNYGYDFSWVRKDLTLGGLSGDLGLKIEMGVKAALGFNVVGHYTVVVCRESEANKLRLQVYKLKSRGWNFAFDASLGGQVTQTLIPDNFDDFIKGVFNLQGSQVLKDFEKWLDPNTTLASLLGAKAIEQAEDLIRKTTGFDPETEFNKGLEKLRSVIQKWKDAPHEITSFLYGFLKQEKSFTDLKKFLKFVAEKTDEELKNEIVKQLKQIDFFENGIGKWLTAAVDQEILSLLANFGAAHAEIQKKAAQTLALLDSSKVEKTLTNLQKWIEEELGLDKIIAIVDKAGFNKLNAWLKKRLSDFLGKTIVFEELEKIRSAVKILLEKAKDFYQKGYAALMDKYQAEFHLTYQKTTTKTALIDVIFDFGADAAKAKTLLKNALQGQFNEIFNTQLNCVQLNKGALTHEIKRNTHLAVAVPYFDFVADHINKAVTEGGVVDSQDGRLWVFNLRAQDVVSKKHRLSKLSVAADWSRKTGVREFAKRDFNFDYVLRLTRKNARREYFEQNLSVPVNEYLRSEFSFEDKPSFTDYLSALDKKLDLLGVPNDNFFGTALVSLSVSLPGDIVKAWENVPADDKSPVYMQVSKRVQELLREYIPAVYIDDIDDYKELPVIYPLLAYSALPPKNNIKLTSNGVLKFDEKKLFWDTTDTDLRAAILNTLAPPALRSTILPKVRGELSNVNTQEEYQDNDIPKIVTVTSSNISEANFNNLISREREIIEKIVKTAVKYREFLDAAKFDKAVEALTEFGEFLTDAFNAKIGGLYSGKRLRPLGTLIFLEVSRIFDPSLKVNPLAMLELDILKPDSTFNPKDFLDGTHPANDQTVVQQRIVSTGGKEL